MKKRNIIAIACGIVFAAFTAVAFFVPFFRNTNFWSGYIFGCISILFLGVQCYRSGSSEKLLKSRFYGWQVVGIAGIYTLLQLICSLLLFAIPTVPSWAGLLISLLLLLFAILGSIVGETANQKIEKIGNYRNEKVNFLRSLELDISNLSSKCDDSILTGKLHQLQEKIRYSDPMSSPKLSNLESLIQTQCQQLGKLVVQGDLSAAQSICDQLIQMVEERNQRCRLLK